MISTITHTTLPKPDTSRRRNRSPNTVISNQNHSTKINIEKTSARKLGKVKPPGNNMELSVCVIGSRYRPGTQPAVYRQLSNSDKHCLQSLILVYSNELCMTMPPAPRNPASTLSVVASQIRRKRAALRDAKTPSGHCWRRPHLARV